MAVKYLAGDRLIGTAAERAALVTGLPDWELGTEAASIATDPDWEDVGSHNVTYDASTDGLDMIPSGNNYGANAGYYIDINALITGSISETAWVLRLKWVQETWVVNSTSGLNSVFLFLTDSTDPSSSHDSIGLGIHNYVTTPQGIRLVSAIGQDNNNPIGNSEAVLTPTATTYWIELKRTSATAATCSIYTNSDFSTGQQGSTVTRTITSSLDGLRYLSLWALMQTSSGNNYNNVSIKWFKFWNGVTTATATSYPNLTNGTIFEESDTGKHYMFDGTSTWNEVT